MVGWRYAGPFDDLPAVRSAFAAGTRDDPGRRRTSTVVVAVETRSARTRGPASSTSRPAAAPRTSSSARRSACRSSRRSTRSGIFVDGFGPVSGRDVRDVADPIVEHLKRTGRFYRLETITHRYPHCWRCGTPLVFRLVDEWYISMGPLYDQPRETLTRSRSTPACATRSWRSSTGSAGSRTSAMSASWTGSATCTTG